jgi:NAD(P) transhydrogenase subunit alpha
VVAETAPGERRVAVVPEAVRRLVGAGWAVAVERGAGRESFVADNDYIAAGAEVVGDRAALVRGADVVLSVQPVPMEVLGAVAAGRTVVSLLAPSTYPDHIRTCRDRGLTAFALELVPRISRAQSMDALSSQASLAGYRAVLIAAEELPRFFPMLTTAAGTIKPASVLVLGAGVAGLQAIATAKRLGALVTAFDVRSVVKEQIESLGARFLDLGLDDDAEGAGGYAKELGEDQQRRQREALAEAAGRFDVAITTAQIPGRRAPLLLTAQAVENMKPGAVIVDLAGESGGNVELTEAGRTVERHGVKIIAPTNLPGEMPDHASQLYARNVQSLLELMVKDGKLELDFEDEVIAGACITRGGEIVHEGAKQAAAAPAA